MFHQFLQRVVVSSVLLLTFNSPAYASQKAEQGEKVATYKVTFYNLWNARDHLAFPRNAHFSPIVAVSHTSQYNIFRVGELARPSFEPLAELGDTRMLQRELREQKNMGSVDGVVETEALFPHRDGNRLSFTIQLSSTHPYLSFATMIAPSPDWVVGVDSVKLYANGGFLQGFEMDLHAINAGTENGDRGGNFSINNSPTRPQQPIAFFNMVPGLIAPFAMVRVEKIK